MKRLSVALTVIASLALAGMAIGSTTFTHATGGIALSGPSQYVSFDAFDFGATGDRGSVAYANFDYPAPGTGVWNVGGTYPLDFVVGGSTYSHSMTVASVSPLSATASKFSGTGFYVPDPSYTWSVKGSVHDSTIDFVIVYTGTGAGYSVTATGTIAADGSMSGTATASDLQTLTWSTPAGSVHEVLSYRADVSCAVIDDTTATFVFQIPAGFPGLSGLDVVAKVVDGGTPGTNGDTWAHGLASTPCDGPASAYPIVGGNLVVH
jgi:hypothetical protein